MSAGVRQADPAPTPQAVREARKAWRLTQTQAGALVHTTCRTWQQWEAGDREMHPAFWELFCLKAPTASAQHGHPEISEGHRQ